MSDGSDNYHQCTILQLSAAENRGYSESCGYIRHIEVWGPSQKDFEILNYAGLKMSIQVSNFDSQVMKVVILVLL